MSKILWTQNPKKHAAAAELYYGLRFEEANPCPDALGAEGHWGVVGWMDTQGQYVALKTGRRDVVLTEDSICVACDAVKEWGETMIDKNADWDGLLCWECVKEEEYCD